MNQLNATTQSVSSTTIEQLKASDPTPAEARDKEAQELQETSRRREALNRERSRRNAAASRHPDPLAHDGDIARSLSADIIVPSLASAIIVEDLAANDADIADAKQTEPDAGPQRGLSGQM